MKEVLSLRISADIKKQIEKEADKQGRSRSNLIQLVLKQYLESAKTK